MTYEDNFIPIKQLFDYIEPRRYFSGRDARAIDIFEAVCRGVKTTDIAKEWSICTKRISQIIIKLVRRILHPQVSGNAFRLLGNIDKSLIGLRKTPEFWLERLEEFKSFLKLKNT